MKIEQLQPGCLTITAETSQEVQKLFKHFDLNQSGPEFIAALVAGTYTHQSKPVKRPWFAVSTVAGSEWLAPYFDRLAFITGFTGDVGDMQNVPWNDYAWPLCHTHMVTRADIISGEYVATGFIQAEDWNGQPANVRASANFAEYIRDFLGRTKREPEYLELANGLLKRNPDYLRRHAPKPAMESLALWDRIFTEWRERFATPEQRETLDNAEKCYQTVCRGPRAFSDMLSREYNGFHADNWTRSVTFEQFRAMGEK